ncbi:MAG: hypothetical protein L3J82_03120 [Planctomycetes bacterium]|nr:hypothetical protein [Planctomycetota bacterium]
MNEERKARKRGQSPLLKGDCPLFLTALLLVLAACGGGNTSNGLKIADLGCDSEPKPFFEDTKLPEANTPAHKKLRSFVPPDPGLKRQKTQYGNWNSAEAFFTAGNEEQATLPAIRVKYETFEHKVSGGDNASETVKQKHTQQCTLIIITCADRHSANAVIKDIAKKLLGKGKNFRDLGPMEFSGKSTKGNDINTFERIDEGDVDSVISVYTQQLGKYVVYALETELMPPLKDNNGNLIKLPTTGQRGSRYGAALLALASLRVLSRG